MDEPVDMAQCKGQSLVYLQQKHGYQDGNKIDVTCDLESLLHSPSSLDSMYKMSDIEVLQVYFILK